MTRYPRLVSALMIGAIACVSHWPAVGAFGQAVPSAAPAVAATPGNGVVKLSWTPVSGALGYRVFRGANSKWEPNPIITTRNTTYTNAKLENGVTYSFTVAAYNSAGNGPLSMAANAMPLAPPAEVTVTAGDQRLKLLWMKSAGATSYAIYRKLSTDADFSEIATGVVAPSFVDVGLINGRRYHYRVRALAGDAQSDLSASVSAVAAATSQ